MKIIPLDSNWEKEWNNYADNHPNGWFWHRTEWIKYCLAYTPGSANRSFIVLDNGGTIVGIAPLIVDGDRFAMGGDPVLIPLWHRSMTSIVRGMIEQRIREIAREEQVVIGWWRTSPLADPVGTMLDFGGEARDISWTSQAINLNQSLGDAWKGVRDGHRAEIHRGLRENEIVLFEQNSRVLDSFHEMHTEANGRETRSAETWDHMKGWADGGVNDVILAERNGKAVGGACFYRYKNSVYYASAAYLEEHVAHAVVWTAIRRYLYAGHDAIEIGWLNTGDLAIFKTGFGGEVRKVKAIEVRF